MYIKYLTDLEIEKFITEYVKCVNIERKECYEDATVRIVSAKRTESSVTITTQIKDNTGCKNQSWILWNFAGVCIENGLAKENTKMTKIWCKYIYETLRSHGKSGEMIAKDFLRDYVSEVEMRMEQKIAEAKNTYRELIF